jgi:hypothetical protein
VSAGIRSSNNTDDLTGNIVCVSSAMIQEIKRIIKDSEIMKYETLGWTI